MQCYENEGVDMKKYILPVALNTIILILIPVLLGIIDEQSYKTMIIGMVVFLNPIYLFIQSQIIAKKNEKRTVFILINLAFIAVFLVVVLKQFDMMYFMYYAVMVIFGTRIGSTMRKVSEHKKK